MVRVAIPVIMLQENATGFERAMGEEEEEEEEEEEPLSRMKVDDS